jgi:hypothetical protein
MVFQSSLGQGSPSHAAGPAEVDRVPDREAILPVVEGARARGVADAFEMVGQGAILLDATGAVLHAGTAAQRLMGVDLSVQSGHLVAQTATANRAIQVLVSALLDAGARAESVVLTRSDGLPSLTIRGFAFQPEARSAYQLLAAVLLIDESGD